MKQSRVFAHYGLVLATILVAGTAIRLIGIDWGLPDAPGDRPFHPDEAYLFTAAKKLYSQPDRSTFPSWGGVLYVRMAYLVAALGDGALRHGILMLRLLNVAFALVTALLVRTIGVRYYGPAIGLWAAALLLVFPEHVLSSHFGRPDVLLPMLATLSLLIALRFSGTGRRSLLFWSAVTGGVATSTLLWGLVTLAPLAVLVLVRSGRESAPRVSRVAIGAGIILSGAVLGYAVGSVESLLHLDEYIGSRQSTAAAHASELYTIPLGFIGPISAYAFGSLTLAAAAFGVLLRLRRRMRDRDLVLLSYLVAGYLLLGFMKHQMMRYVLFLAPVVAIFAAIGIESAVQSLGRRLPGPGPVRRFAALTVGLLPILLAGQLSLAYVLTMQQRIDVRHAAGDWLIENAAPRSLVGATLGFRGDRTYTPRLRRPPSFGSERLMMREGYDAGQYVGAELDYVVTTDYAIHYSRCENADLFFAHLRDPAHFALAASIEPAWSPFRLADWLAPPPPDLLYSQLRFYIYEKQHPSTDGSS